MNINIFWCELLPSPTILHWFVDALDYGPTPEMVIISSSSIYHQELNPLRLKSSLCTLWFFLSLKFSKWRLYRIGEILNFLIYQYYMVWAYHWFFIFLHESSLEEFKIQVFPKFFDEELKNFIYKNLDLILNKKWFYIE